jgi:hypothetical protein
MAAVCWTDSRCLPHSECSARAYRVRRVRARMLLSWTRHGIEGVMPSHHDTDETFRAHRNDPYPHGLRRIQPSRIDVFGTASQRGWRLAGDTRRGASSSHAASNGGLP